MQIFDRCAVWNAKKDSKLQALIKLVSQKHKTDKVLVFSQFSDYGPLSEPPTVGRGHQEGCGGDRRHGKRHRPCLPV